MICSIIKLGIQGSRRVLHNIEIQLLMQIHFYNKPSFMSKFYQTMLLLYSFFQTIENQLFSKIIL